MPNAFYIMLAKVIVLTVKYSSLVIELSSQSIDTATKHQIEKQIITILSAQNLL
jgi:hypothetical protein